MTESIVKSCVLFLTERQGSRSDLAFAQKRLELHPLFPERLDDGIKLLFVLFHESEAGPFHSSGKFRRRRFAAYEGGDPTDRPLQVAAQLFIGQEQHIRVVSVCPPPADVLEPRAEF